MGKRLKKGQTIKNFIVTEVHEGMKQKTPLNALLNKALGV